MLGSIHIKNYKSIVDLSLKLGRFNVLIGENGCGKSNILEALTLGAAAHAGSLDRMFLEAKGIRMTAPQFMLPVFDDTNSGSIDLSVQDGDGNEYDHSIIYDSQRRPAGWTDIIQSNNDALLRLLSRERAKKSGLTISEVLTQLDHYLKDNNSNISINDIDGQPSINLCKSKDWIQFQTYSLDEYELRSYSQPGETVLGIHGRGLFSYLKEMSHRPDAQKFLSEIRNGLRLLDWFDDISIPGDELMNENNVFLRDRYISETMNAFDQRSTNEGFLYLLFYLTLIISDDTPPCFAIDNLDSSFNPKLCREVTRILVSLAKKHEKQLIVTTHNPALIDGLDLEDEEQKLMVVQRSVDGYTKVRTIKQDEISDRSIPLSQLWMRGFIGGLPVNF